MRPRSQPYSWCNGVISSPGTVVKAPAVTMAAPATTATVTARRVPGRGRGGTAVPGGGEVVRVR